MLYLTYDSDTLTLYIYESIADTAMPVRSFDNVKAPEKVGRRFQVSLSANNGLLLDLAETDVHILNPIPEESSAESPV
jgi:hypothetical protein